MAEIALVRGDTLTDAVYLDVKKLKYYILGGM